MNKSFGLTVIFLAAGCIVVESAFAQLIRYDRRKLPGGRVAAPAARPSTAKAAVTGPAWMQTPPRVVTSEERKFDLNRDGYLQPSEAKSLLSSLVSQISSSGRVAVTSDFVKPYDRNGDGFISRYEVGSIQTDIQ